MSVMLKRIGRLFTIKTRTEAYLVIYAIAVGAVERGQHYMAVFPGTLGLFMALLCTGVVFLAGAKILDAVRAAQDQATPASRPTPRTWPPRHLNRNRPRASRRAFGASAVSRHID